MFLLLLACTSAAHQIEVAHVQHQSGELDMALATYDEIMGRWPGTPEAAQAATEAEATLLEYAVALYGQGEHLAAGQAMLRLGLWLGPTQAADKARQAADEGLVLSARFAEVAANPGGGGALGHALALMGDPQAPRTLGVQTGLWACEHRTAFAEYGVCADPRSSLQASGVACGRLAALAPGCPAEVRSELEGMAWTWLARGGAKQALGPAGAAGGDPLDAMVRLSEAAASETPGSVRLELAELSILGAMDRQALLATVDARQDVIEACYARALRQDASIQGELTLKVIVQADGSVKDLQVLDDSLPDAGPSACVQGILRETTFPRPGTQLVVLGMPFSFRPN